mgnify:FL=1
MIVVKDVTIGPFSKFNMELEEGVFSIIAGANNSGKTLLLKILTNLVRYKGKVSYGDITYSEIGLYLNNSFPQEKVLESLRFPLEEKGYDNDKIVKKVNSVSKDLMLESFLDKNIKDLTDYEKVRLHIAICLMDQPKILFLDDPVLYLSFDEKKELMELFNRLNATGLSIIMTTSNLDITVYANNSILYILDKGKIISMGSIYSVLSNDSLINKASLELPFAVDLCVKLKYYNVVSRIDYSLQELVDVIWK